MPRGSAPSVPARSRTIRCACCAWRASLSISISKSTPARGRLRLRQAARIGDVAPERSFYELRRLISGPDPRRGIELMDSVGLVATLLPELEGLKGVEQNPYHHLDVWGHTLEVLDRARGCDGRPRGGVRRIRRGSRARAGAAACRRAHARAGAAVRRAAARRGQAGDARGHRRRPGAVLGPRRRGSGHGALRLAGACTPARRSATTSPRSRSIICASASSCTSSRCLGGTCTATCVPASRSRSR